MSIKNPLTPTGIEPATFRFVAQHLNLCATAVPHIYIYIYIYMDVSEERYAFIYADMETVGSYAACRSFVNKITALAFRKVDQYFD